MKLEKRALQFAIILGGLVPLVAGAAGVIAGVGMIPHTVAEPSLDSHFRYLSGLLVGVGLGFWSTVPDVEHKTRRVRLLTAIVLMGGAARAYGWAAGETPGVPMQLALIMELGVTPLICLWQARVAGRLDRAARRPFKLPVVAGKADALRPDPDPGR